MSAEPIEPASEDTIAFLEAALADETKPSVCDPFRDIVRAVIARIRALEAEIARKDAALRQAIDILQVQGFPLMADFCRAALGPWVPTHQHYKGGLYRELMCGIDAENGPRNGRAVVVYESQDGKCFVLPAVVFDENVYAYQLAPGGSSATEEHVRRYRRLTPDEARAAMENQA